MIFDCCPFCLLLVLPLGGQHSYWMSEAGTVDLFLFGGPEPTAVIEQYTSVTGTTQLPPMFAIAYHQCRWNYKNEEVSWSVEFEPGWLRIR